MHNRCARIHAQVKRACSGGHMTERFGSFFKVRNLLCLIKHLNSTSLPGTFAATVSRRSSHPSSEHSSSEHTTTNALLSHRLIPQTTGGQSRTEKQWQHSSTAVETARWVCPGAACACVACGCLRKAPWPYLPHV